MPPPPTPKHHHPLTLIVATTPIPRPTTSPNEPPRLGIGLHGTLPWPRIKADMSFFARVTSRAPAPGTTNAIVMGRKTYDSVPKSLRPLGKRVSVVVTRDATGGVRERVMRELEEKREREREKEREKVEKAAASGSGSAEGKEEEKEKEKGQQTDALVSTGLEAALDTLEGEYDAHGKLGKVFVIGGAEIYAAALGMGASDSKSGAGGSRPVRIVMTNVEKSDGTVFDCDTFFPVDRELLLQQDGWRKVSAQEVTEWVGETVTGEWRDEGEVRIQMVGYERVIGV